MELRASLMVLVQQNLEYKKNSKYLTVLAGAQWTVRGFTVFRIRKKVEMALALQRSESNAKFSVLPRSADYRRRCYSES